MAELKPYPEYKDSGVEWIGEIPEDWETSKIKYLTVLNNETLSDKTDPEIIIEYIDIGGVDSTGKIEKERMSFGEAPSRARRILRKNDIIISTVRTYLKAIGTISEEEDNLICSTGFAVITPREINSNYLSYLLHSHIYIDQIVSRSVGVSYPAINSSEIGRLNCILPPKLIQDNIAQYLNQKTSGINRVISDKKRLIKLLEEKRQAIIIETITKGLDPNVKMKDSGIEWIGEIPENWEFVSLKYLTNHNLKYGANESAIDNKTDGWRYIRITDIDEKGKLKEDTRKTLPEEIAENYALSEGDILFARSGATVGKTYIHETDKKSCYAGYLIRYRANKNKLMPKFLYFYTQSNIYVNWIKEQLIQATIENVSAEKYANFKILLPTRHEQEEIVKSIQKNLNQNSRLINYLQEQIKKLKEYRESLIYEAVTGKIDLREYEVNSSEYTTYEQVAESDEAYMKSD